ncbi:related to ribosomal protein L16 precursor, mitochondrial [Cephalotrichum gorgonifer]|uniref:Related to ribosomal protein L16, mitochondrial n=1 Tax=Cephalotrichum gorgonifer TaxID=2041049 RepID=A0AAE8N1P9_9PEZI|nr:related to ribosomal protein L16 precursor, mitochondrial [Cephalotrichum gorgonifer]
MKRNASAVLSDAFQGLRISSSVRPGSQIAPVRTTVQLASHARLLSTTSARMGTWLEPSIDRNKKMMKGRVRVPTGGSTKGTTVIWGEYGLRMNDFGRRISAKHLKMAEDTIKNRMRGEKYRLYKRVCCNVGVFTSGNETRMGKGKGSFDHWAARVAVNQVLFEIKGLAHERVIRDAFRLAGNKLPGHYECIVKGEAPIVGLTKLDGVTLDELKRPRRKNIPPALLAAAAKAGSVPRSSESEVASKPTTEPTTPESSS